MKTLTEHNEAQAWRRQQASRIRTEAGVRCPKCKIEEMHYINPGEINLSDPPSAWVHCKGCGYKGLKR